MPGDFRKQNYTSRRAGHTGCVQRACASCMKLPITPSINNTLLIEALLSSSDRRADGSPRCQVSTLLRILCGGDASGSRNERVSGAKNAQLHCVTGGSPRQPSTPQLLRILEETIQKKAPRPHHYPSPTEKEIDRLRLTFHIPQKTADSLFQYRTKFVQHMLSSSMYANSAVMKPWEMIGSVSEQLIDEILLECVKEMELQEVIQELYKSETR